VPDAVSDAPPGGLARPSVSSDLSVDTPLLQADLPAHTRQVQHHLNTGAATFLLFSKITSHKTQLLQIVKR
jgi:hypothetical protein